MDYDYADPTDAQTHPGGGGGKSLKEAGHRGPHQTRKTYHGQTIVKCGTSCPKRLQTNVLPSVGWYGFYAVLILHALGLLDLRNLF